MNKTPRKASLDHLNFTVRNFDETAEWYGKIFGFEVAERGVYEGEPWGVLKNGDSMLFVYERAGKTSPGHEETERFHKLYHFGLRIHDRSGWEKTLHDQNLRTYHGSPIRYPHSTSWYVADPTGHVIEVALWDDDEARFG